MILGKIFSGMPAMYDFPNRQINETTRHENHTPSLPQGHSPKKIAVKHTFQTK